MAKFVLAFNSSKIKTMLFSDVHLVNHFKYKSVRWCSSEATNKSDINTNSREINVTRLITQKDVDDFSKLTGDLNPIHKSDEKQKVVVHGAFLNGLVSGAIGTHLPGAMVLTQILRFPKACHAGDEVRITVHVPAPRKIITCTFQCVLKNTNSIVLEGEVKLLLTKV